MKEHTEMRPPNIVIILADDMGYGDLGCYGNTMIRTPNIDGLATAGMRFTDFHSNGAVCSPTRAALLTGRYQQRCGIEGVVTAANHRDVGMALSEYTFAKALKEAGYRTALFGKWHLGYDRQFNPVRHGFDEFRGFVSGNIDYHSHIDQVGEEDWWSDAALAPEDGYTTDLVTRYGVRFIEGHREDPFCLYLAHECPHYPYQGPDDPAFRTPGHPEPVQGPREDKVAAYKEMIEALDQGVGEVMRALDRSGLRENTLVFFFSDNGPAGPGSAGGLRGRKASVWEGGHRVPAIASWPGRVGPGTETDHPAMGMDLFPTMLELAGLAPQETPKLDGVSLVPLLTGTSGMAERDLFWRCGNGKAVRRDDWKLVVSPDDGLSNANPQLFDLAADPAEANDIAGSEPTIMEELSRALEAWEADVSAGVRRLT